MLKWPSVDSTKRIGLDHKKNSILAEPVMRGGGQEREGWGAGGLEGQVRWGCGVREG